MGPVPQTGLSHGAAGMGLALRAIRGHRAKGLSKTARAAFAFEDALFDPSRGNWPDLRRNIERPEPSLVLGATEHQGSRWPGLHASMVDDELKGKAIAPRPGPQSRRRSVPSTKTSRPRRHTTLCHGLAGLGEIVLLAGLLLDDPTYRDRSLDLARALIGRHSGSEEWPSGVPSRVPIRR